ncbi:MAG: hypothetical protein JO286_06845 [Solirubrobacterales bacterium]|nr:hypothetical protein [Solirubrobacterales bacterium]MBV9806882.1 hypothetical protein [Solirubrobacterales bacterium]
MLPCDDYIGFPSHSPRRLTCSPGGVDAVLVDEAQDFLPDWLDALELLLDEGEGIMFLFADESRAIYRRGSRGRRTSFATA